jgi:hypothetical protein
MKKEHISLRIPSEILNRLDEIADLADMDRTRLIINILDECSKSMMATKKIGVLQFSILMRDMSDSMKEWANKIKRITRIDELTK